MAGCERNAASQTRAIIPMKVVIVGAGGLVGKAFSKALAAHEIVSLHHHELDVTNAAAVDANFTTLCPDLIVNCAVVGVDASEIDPRKANAVNVIGAEDVASAA